MKNFLIITFVLILVILTSVVKTSTRNLEGKIFAIEEEVKLLSNKKELVVSPAIIIGTDIIACAKIIGITPDAFTFKGI